MFIDRKFRVPRIWSNQQLKKFGHLFAGDVINVSGWTDIDKEGGHYKDYFKNAKSYSISNFKTEARGLQGAENEFFLDLEKDLDQSLVGKFDVVFNHTTLEHIYGVNKAFQNLCLMSKDVVVLVIPFLQQMHGDYGDYWRFTPTAIKKMFEANGFSLLYLSFNNNKKSSVYIFAIASKNPDNWKNKISSRFTYQCSKNKLDPFENYIGCNAIENNLLYKLKLASYKILKSIKK